MSSMPFHIIATDHTGITVSNLERSLAFWRDVLGFELSHRAHHTGELASEVTGVPGAEILLAVLRGYGHKVELLEYLVLCARKHLGCYSFEIGAVGGAPLVVYRHAVFDSLRASGCKS